MLGSTSFGEWAAVAFVVIVIALWAGLKVVTWRRERSMWHDAMHSHDTVTRMHEEPPEAPPHQRAA
jgi:hypothetical protein